MSVAVVDRHGRALMPTSNFKARRLLKSGRARIYRYRPVFVIMIADREVGETQPVEYKCDTGYEHIGISVCSEKKEFISAQYDLLPDEKQKHSAKLKYRRARRNRKRYRKPRFDNRKGMICSDGFAPSIRNKRDLHIQLFQKIAEVIPVTKAVIEMGQFDTQVLKAVEEGRPLPQGTDYQMGERYGYDTLREAVFARDGYRCICCGKGVEDGTIFRMHHLGYLSGDRSNRMANLGTVCTGCHTSKNHKPGGKLYGLKPKLKAFKGATFMTAVRWDMLKRLKTARPDIDIRVTYGAVTKEQRSACGLKKSHVNDAYSMGDFHPCYRSDTRYFRKKRRNNRILEKFYDAKYVDLRDGSKKSGGQLSCGRTNRSESRHTDKDERMFRAYKVSKGRRSIRTQRHKIQAGDIVLFKGKRYRCHGTMSGGKSILLLNAKESPTGKAVTSTPSKVCLLRHCSGWTEEKTALYPHS